ncbi:MAG: site-specific integrase [Chromatiaceae bacterium]|nr:site-specific integrase [Chromatiaceae bacterium]
MPPTAPKTHTSDAPMADGDAQLVERFADAVWMERGLSENTRNSYQSDLRHCARWLHQSSGSSLSRVRRDQLLGYLAATVDAGMKPRTSARRLSTLRQFFQWALRENSLHPIRRRRSRPRVSVDLCPSRSVRRRSRRCWRRQTWIPRKGCVTVRCWRCCTRPA